MYAISPALLYHSRYIRDEVMLTSLLVLLVVCMFRYLETRSAKWLVGTAVTLAFAFLTMEASFIFGGVFGIFLVLALTGAALGGGLARRRAGGRRQIVPHRWSASALALLAVGLVLVIFKVKVPGLVLLGVGAVLALLAVGAGGDVMAHEAARFRRARSDRLALHPGDAVPVGAGAEGDGLADQPVQHAPDRSRLPQVWQGLLVLGVLFVSSAADRLVLAARSVGLSPPASSGRSRCSSSPRS